MMSPSMSSFDVEVHLPAELTDGTVTFWALPVILVMEFNLHVPGSDLPYLRDIPVKSRLPYLRGIPVKSGGPRPAPVQVGSSEGVIES